MTKTFERDIVECVMFGKRLCTNIAILLKFRIDSEPDFGLTSEQQEAGNLFLNASPMAREIFG